MPTDEAYDQAEDEMEKDGNPPVEVTPRAPQREPLQAFIVEHHMQSQQKIFHVTLPDMRK
eukprot:680772-Amphidinium_carterae.1